MTWNCGKADALRLLGSAEFVWTINYQVTQLDSKTELSFVQQRWDKVEEKPVAVAIGGTALIVIWAASGLIDRIDKLPLVGGLLELVGLLVTGWFVYRYLVFGPDR